jgi:hypothetical protein
MFYVSFGVSNPVFPMILILHLTGLSFVDFIQEHYIVNDEGFAVFK